MLRVIKVQISKEKNSRIKVCDHCGDSSQKIIDNTYEESSNRANNIIARNNKCFKGKLFKLSP